MFKNVRRVLVVALVLTILSAYLPASRAQSQNSVGGGAVGARASIQATALGVPSSASLPGVAPVTLPPNGGSFTNQAASSSAEMPGLLPSSSTGTVTDTTSGGVTQSSAHAESMSEVNNANVLGGLISASHIVSKAASTGNGTAATSTGAGSFVEGLTIGTTVYDQREFPPNTTFAVSGNINGTVAGLPVTIPVAGTVVINEQTPGGNGTTTTSLTVNYIHVMVSGNAPGMISFTQDEVIASASSSVNFTANTPGNSPPVLNLPGPQSVQVGNTLTFNVSATDPDAGDTVKITATGIPPNAVFTPNPATGNPATGQFSFTPSADQTGQPFTVTFTADDSRGGVTPGSVQISVTGGPAPGNHPPALNLPGAQTAEIGKTLGFNVSASDPDAGDTVTLTASGMPANADLAPNPSTGNPATAHFGFTPTQSQLGQVYTVPFNAVDSHGASTSGSVSITVTEGANHRPVISVPGPQIIGVGQTLTFAVAGSDPDGDVVTLSAGGVPINASFDPGTGGFSFTPSNSQLGQIYAVTFTATDPKGSSASAPVQITVVTESTAGPAIISVPPSPIVVPVDEMLVFDCKAISPIPNCSVGISASGLPDNATFDPAANRFRFTPSLDQANKTFVVTFTATDCGGHTSKATVTIIVIGPAADSVPGRVCVPATKLFFDSEGVGGCCGSITVTVTNTGGGPLTVTSVGFVTGTNFSVAGASQLPVVLQPGGSIPLAIAFQPRQQGMQTDTLTITTSDPNNPTVTIDLKGKGTKP